MSEGAPAPPQSPDVLYGMLPAGGRITRSFSYPCPANIWPIVFSPQPGAKIAMAGVTETDITVHNQGPLPAAYMVCFVARETMGKLAHVKNVFESLQGAYAAFRKPPGNN